MSIELPPILEKELQALAVLQRRDLHALVEEAVRFYLEAAALTDLTVEEIAETQLALVAEGLDSPAALPVSLKNGLQRSPPVFYR